MANLIKNALVKQISKFLKNVSPNQINISTLKGEGEMKNIQLNEEMLMNVLEIPTWLRITSARCNKASVKIQWTKLKTNPIIIILDKIELDMEIADPLREYTSSNLSNMFDKDSSGAYGFIDKCIDAIQLIIDSITITIKSKTFNANLNISNIRIYSVTPNWKVTNDIRNTRLKDLEKDEIILFKEVSWEICRLEAFNIESDSQNHTSIKLIMNPSKIRIVLKKKLSDKSLINSTIRILLNEIYWMASDTQLKAAIGTYKTLSKLMTKSFEQKKKYVQIQQQQNKSNSPVKNLNTSEKTSNEILSKVFLQYDIKETSIHLQISNLNIHLYADDNYSVQFVFEIYNTRKQMLKLYTIRHQKISLENLFRISNLQLIKKKLKATKFRNNLIDGGSMQFLFKNVFLDHYPYHKVGSSTKHWNNYNHTFVQRDEWSKSLLNEFTSKLEEIFKNSNIYGINNSLFKNGINLLESCTIFSLKDFCIYKVTTNLSNKQANVSSMRAKKLNQEKSISEPITYDSINDFLKMKNFFLDQQMFNMRPFLSSNSSEFNLPTETLFANCFLSDFYFAENVNYPVPSQQIYAQISPIFLNIDFLTLLWMNTLAFSLWREKLIADEKDKSEKKHKNHFTKNYLHCDTYLEVILPKVNLTIYPTKLDSNVNFRDQNFTPRPNGIEIGMAKLVLTNRTLIKSNNNYDEFSATCQKAYKFSSNLIEKNINFKNKVKNYFEDNDIRINSLAPCFNEILQNDNLSLIRDSLGIQSDHVVNAKEGLFLKNLNKNALNKDAAKDIWIMEIESLWVDMIDKDCVPFVQNASFKIFAVNIWEFLSKSSILMEQTDQEDTWDKSSSKEYSKVFNRLEKIIKIEKKTEFDAKVRKRSNSLSNKSTLIRSKTKSELLCKKIYSNLNVATRIKNINIYINHSQILFLLRFIDVIDIFFNQIKIDTEQTLKFRGRSQIAENVRKPRRKSLKLDFFEEEIDQDLNEPSVNLALCIDNIQVELLIDDLRRDIQFQPEQTNEDQESQENLIESYTNLEEKKSIEKLNSTIDDYNVVTMQAEKDLIFNYIRYVYGLSTDMPNSSFNFNFVPSFKDLQKEQDSGCATEKSNLASNLSNKALSGLTKLTNKLSESGEDLLADDNDNISMIMNLAQEDNVSVVSENMLDTTKYSPSRSISSASETSSFTASIGQMNKLDQLKSNSTSSNISKFTTNNDQIIQTDSAKTKVGIKLKNLAVYVQTQGENLMSLISLDQIKIRDKISQNFDENKLRDILIRFKKSSHDPESSNGLAELYVENFKIELDIPTLTALVDLVDDTDDFKTNITDTIAIKAYIYSCGVKLNDDPFKKYVNNPKALDLYVDSLLFKKSSDNKLIINEIKTRKNDEFDSPSLRLQLNKDVFCESKFVQESKSDLSCYEFRSRQNLKIDSDKFASMVVMLRKEKETYHLLQTKMEKQKSEFNAKEKEMSSKLELVETENQLLKKEIESLKMNRSMINNCEDDRIKSLNETLEIERKQFESLLLGSQEENELLKSKLKKTEDYVALLNIERECLMKKINQSKF